MTSIKCRCQNSFQESEFNKHFPMCREFKNYFKDFDIQFGDLLKRYSEEKENLFIVRLLLKQYTIVIEKKIKQK